MDLKKKRRFRRRIGPFGPVRPLDGSTLGRDQTARRPKTKCRINEMTAKISRRWISPPATWKTVKPHNHAINRMINNTVQMLICISSYNSGISMSVAWAFFPPAVQLQS